MEGLFRKQATQVPEWLRTLLVAAGVYHILWAMLVLLFPGLLFTRMDISVTVQPYLWQCIGAFEGAFGIGYLMASKNPAHHWLVIFAGFLSKIFVPVVFLNAWLTNTIAGDFEWIIFMNYIVWWIPLGALVHFSYREHILEKIPLDAEHFLELEFHMVRTNRGTLLSELSDAKPVMLVFLRHFGCTFCRETLRELNDHLEGIHHSGKELVVVHMSDPGTAGKFLHRYGLDDVHHISDPNRDLYRYFGLQRGFLGQVMGLKNWARYISAGLKRKNLMGKPRGDIFQMPGIFLYYKGKIKMKYLHHSAADQPDYEKIIGCPVGE